MPDHEDPPLLTIEQQDEAERRERTDAVGRHFAEAQKPNKRWAYLGIMILIPALPLLAYTWNKEGSGTGRYGRYSYHPRDIPTGLTLISILLIRKGLGKGD